MKDFEPNDFLVARWLAIAGAAGAAGAAASPITRTIPSGIWRLRRRFAGAGRRRRPVALDRHAQCQRCARRRRRAARPGSEVSTLQQELEVHRNLGKRTARGQAGRRIGDDGQGRVPGHHEPRNPHAAQRHHPDARPADELEAAAGPARIPAHRLYLVAADAADRRRHPRLLQARGQQAAVGVDQLQPARTARLGDPADGKAGRKPRACA